MELASYLSYPPAVLKDQFEYGLKEEMKKLIAMQPPTQVPTDFEAFRTWVIMMDTRTFASQRRAPPPIQYQHRPSFPTTTPAPPPATTTYNKHVRPMEVDATQTQPLKPLTDREREELRKRGACFRCRMVGHRANQCQKRPQTTIAATCQERLGTGLGTSGDE